MGEDNQGLDPRIYGSVGPGEMSLYVPLIDGRPRYQPSTNHQLSVKELMKDLENKSRTFQIQYGQD